MRVFLVILFGFFFITSNNLYAISIKDIIDSSFSLSNEADKKDLAKFQIIYRSGAMIVGTDGRYNLIACNPIVESSQIDGMCTTSDVLNANKIRIYQFNENDIIYAAEEDGNQLAILFNLTNNIPDGEKSNDFVDGDSAIIIYDFFNIPPEFNRIRLYFGEDDKIGKSIYEIQDKFQRTPHHLWQKMYENSIKKVIPLARPIYASVG